MIPLRDVSWQGQDWQWQLANAVRDPAELCSLLGLPPVETTSPFPMLAPLPFVARMRAGDPHDPLLRQVLSHPDENLPVPGFTTDPLDEASVNPVKGLLHKYHGRVLIVTTGQCAVNCRYCFRRHFPYDSNQPDTNDWDRILGYVAADSSISEVILSGGDPLVLPDRRLQWIVSRIEAIPHVTTLRLHTRLPVVIPQRVTTALGQLLLSSRLQVVTVLHTNHANEIDADVAAAIARLRAAGVTMLNQSVLLKGVNDCTETLVELSTTLFESGVLPYYLHQLDRVDGAAHFSLEPPVARELIKEIRSRLPGYLVPRFVTEQPGAPGKEPVSF